MAERKKKEGKRAKKVEKPHPGEINVYSLDGKVQKKVELPSVFHTEFRKDLIRRAVNTYQANRRQAYGPNPMSGMRHAVSTWGKGRGVARVQRITGGRRAAESPGNVGGRRAHPPRSWRIWREKMNLKERRKARNSALSALKDANLVSSRGHTFKKKLTLPIVVQNEIEELDSLKDAIETLKEIGVYEDVIRANQGRKVRAGRGKMRSRRYRKPRSLLLVFSKLDKARRSFGNLPGIDLTTPRNLNTELLAPGGDAGRLTLFSEKAFEELRSW